MAQPILTDGGPPAWAVDKRAELGWPSSRGKGWAAVCKSGPRLCKSTVLKLIETITHVCDKMEFIFVSLDTRADSLSLYSRYIYYFKSLVSDFFLYLMLSILIGEEGV